MVTVMLPKSSDPAAVGKPDPVDILILGAGWTYQFLPPLLKEHNLSHAATTTTGRDGTIPFRFDPESDDDSAFCVLPKAKTIVITFPLKGRGPSRKLIEFYTLTYPSARPNWIQLGSTGIFTTPGWSNSRSDYNKTDQRAVAEDELLFRGGAFGRARACVLDLAGLYDGTSRDPRRWLARVAQTKEQLKAKGAVHFVHGGDVARAIVAAHERFDALIGRRWIVADLRTYDWWELAIRWGGEQYARWVLELMEEEGVGALPRGVDRFGRVLDSREFWAAVGARPLYGIPGANFEAPRGSGGREEDW
jgi:hypothetical protein